MKFSSLITTALAFAGSVLSTTTSTQSPLDTLASSMKARNAAVNSTVAGYRAGSIPLDVAATYIKGNLSAVRGLTDDFKATVTSLMSGFNATNDNGSSAAIGPGGSAPPGFYNSKELPRRAQDVFDAFTDLSYTLAPVQDDPGLGAAVQVLEYVVLVAQSYLGIAEFLLVFAYDELFLPGGYPWGIALPY